MNRYVRAATAALLAAGGLGSAGCHGGGCKTGGCGGKPAAHGGHAGRAGTADGPGAIEARYRNLVDANYPERYNFAARQSVVGVFGQQVANGHLQHQTLWNWYFEPGTDKLNPAGMEKLDSLHRTPGGPDPKVYLQTARDVGVNPENAGEVRTLRDDLTAKRAAAVLKYLSTQPGAAVPYEVGVVDAPTPGINSLFAASAYRGQAGGYSGGLVGGGGVGVPSVGGGGSIVTPGAGAPGAGAAPGGAGARGPGY
ncbi:MAG: hypothetical protein C0501_26730 [Isosphaera sp.]|nr:hypothetical protein [Isosphaera sp.]